MPEKCFFHKGMVEKKGAAAIVFAPVALEPVVRCRLIKGSIHFFVKADKRGEIKNCHEKNLNVIIPGGWEEKVWHKLPERTGPSCWQ